MKSPEVARSRQARPAGQSAFFIKRNIVPSLANTLDNALVPIRIFSARGTTTLLRILGAQTLTVPLSNDRVPTAPRKKGPASRMIRTRNYSISTVSKLVSSSVLSRIPLAYCSSTPSATRQPPRDIPVSGFRPRCVDARCGKRRLRHRHMHMHFWPHTACGAIRDLGCPGQRAHDHTSEQISHDRVAWSRPFCSASL